MPEFTPAALRLVLHRIEQQGRTAARTGLIDLSDAVVKQARTNASSGSHAYGTPTPARPGSGPAVISGTLRSSIDRTAVILDGLGWSAKVGLVPGKVPKYRKGRSSTPSSKYGSYLEKGLKNGAKYPFLEPATHLVPLQAEVLFKRAFAAVKWPT